MCVCVCVVSECVFVIRERERERESEVKKHTFLLFIIIIIIVFGFFLTKETFLERPLSSRHFKSPTLTWKNYTLRTMSDHEVETFESTDAGASLTVPMQAGSVRKGGYIVIKGKACKVRLTFFDLTHTREKSEPRIRARVSPRERNMEHFARVSNASRRVLFVSNL